MIKKLITIVALATTTFVSANAQLLYRITSDSQQKPSYIVGTFHLEDDSYLDKIPGVWDAVDEVDQVYGEMDIKTMTNPDSIAIIQKATMLPEGKTIKDILTAEQFERLDKYVESVFGVPFSNPMLFQQMGKMNPTTLNLTLGVTSFLQKTQETFDQNNTIDFYLPRIAMEKGKKTGGLETMTYQTKIIYGRPMNETVEELMCSVDNYEFYDNQNILILDAYHEQDIEKIIKISLMKLGNSCDMTEEYMNALIFNRNSDWAKKIPAIIKNSPTLFVVGAGHLGGEKGVVNLLRKAGFKVEGVK